MKLYNVNENVTLVIYMIGLLYYNYSNKKQNIWANYSKV